MDLQTEKLIRKFKDSIVFDEENQSWYWKWTSEVTPDDVKKLIVEVERLKVVEQAYGAYLKAK